MLEFGYLRTSDLALALTFVLPSNASDRFFGGYNRSFSLVPHDIKSYGGKFGRGVKPLTLLDSFDILLLKLGAFLQLPAFDWEDGVRLDLGCGGC